MRGEPSLQSFLRFGKRTVNVAISGCIINILGGRISVLVSLIHLVLFIFLFIYRIRIFLQILKLFGLSKKWLILWLVANWLPLLIIGLGKKYQPKK